jgi:hypothetical protein
MKRRRSICSDRLTLQKAPPSKEERGFLLPVDFKHWPEKWRTSGRLREQARSHKELRLSIVLVFELAASHRRTDN